MRPRSELIQVNWAFFVKRLRLCLSNSPSSCHWELDQTAGLGDPANIVELCVSSSFATRVLLYPHFSLLCKLTPSMREPIAPLGDDSAGYLQLMKDGRGC